MLFVTHSVEHYDTERNRVYLLPNPIRNDVMQIQMLSLLFRCI